MQVGVEFDKVCKLEWSLTINFHGRTKLKLKLMLKLSFAKSRECDRFTTFSKPSQLSTRLKLKLKLSLAIYIKVLFYADLDQI